MDDLISPNNLNDLRGGFPPPLIIDVRRKAAFESADRMLPGAIHRDPEHLAQWAGDLEIGRPIVVHCVRGQEVSQAAAAALRDRGFAARYLEGGFEGWVERGLPVQPKPSSAPTLWVTRERPKVDRIACPWLIRRFIDPDARFLYVPAEQVLSVAQSAGAVPYDIPNVELGHHGDQCSFDAFIDRYELRDPALALLAEIVRGADTGHPDIIPEAAGLVALSRGLSDVFDDDHRQLRHGLVMYDALFAWCRGRNR
jgi:rhodanese-related sulfurtransferase